MTSPPVLRFLGENMSDSLDETSDLSSFPHMHNVQLHGVLQSSNNINTDSADVDLLIDVQRPQEKGTSKYAAVFLVVNAALGAGLLNFPQAFDQAGGILVAIIVQCVLLVFVILALIILAYCSDAYQSSTYQDVVLHTCGKRAQNLCSVAVALYCYGTCITFFIIIGDQFDRALASLYGKSFCHYWYMDRKFTMIVSSFVFILPYCFPRRIDFLKYASSFGVLAVLYVVFLIIYKFYEGKFQPGPIKTHPTEWSDVFLVVPVICFGYQCHVSCVPVYCCLENRRVTVFLETVLYAMVICILTYTVAATYGYLTFGSLVASDILESYDAKDPVVLIGVFALLLKTYTTYPILLFCGRSAIDDLYLQIRKLDPEVASHNEFTRRIITVVIWFISSITLAAVIPNIGIVIEILGSLAAVFIFIFPGLCLMNVALKDDPMFLQRRTKLLLFLASCFLVLGALIFGLVFTQSIVHNVDSSNQMKTVNLCI